MVMTHVKESPASYNRARNRTIFVEEKKEPMNHNRLFKELIYHLFVEFTREIGALKNAREFTKLPNSWEERGIRKGIQQGMEEAKKEGSPIEFISKVTHLDKEAIEKLRKSNRL